MARTANTFVQSGSKVNREELANVVSRITPEDTPIYSMIRKTKCSSIHPEWTIDELAAPAENSTLEGDEFTWEKTEPVVRVGNYCQIFRKTGRISKTQQSVMNAGNAEKIRYQVLKKGVELRKDVEFAIVSNTASSKESGANGRKLGSLQSWLTSNTLRGSGGADGGFKSADGFTDAVNLAANGSRRAFTKTLLDSNLKQIYEAGGNVKYSVMSPYLKQVFVTFMSDTNVAAFRYATSGGGKNTIVGTADMYEGPHGKVTVVSNRVMGVTNLSRNVFNIDTSMLNFCWLRRIQRVKNLAVTGDAQQFVLIGEGTLKVKNEAGLGVIADLFGLSATTS